MIQQQLRWSRNMERSTQTIKNSALTLIEQIKKDNEYKTQYHALYPKFDTVLHSADQLSSYINGLKQTLNEEPNNPINTDTLTTKIQDFYQQSIRLAENTWSNGGIKGTIFADESYRKRAILNLKEDLSTVLLDKIRTNPNQLKTQLESKPVAAKLNLLSSIKNDLQKQAYSTFEFFAMQIGGMCDYGYTRFDIAIQPDKHSISLGETYRTDILYAKYAKATILSVEVEGENIPIIENRATYSIKPKKIGEQTFHTKLTFLNPHTNRIDSLERSFYFNVKK